MCFQLLFKIRVPSCLMNPLLRIHDRFSAVTIRVPCACAEMQSIIVAVLQTAHGCVVSHSCPRLIQHCTSLMLRSLCSQMWCTTCSYICMSTCSPCFASSTESFSVVDLQGNERSIPRSLQAATCCCVQHLQGQGNTAVDVQLYTSYLSHYGDCAGSFDILVWSAQFDCPKHRVCLPCHRM